MLKISLLFFLLVILTVLSFTSFNKIKFIPNFALEQKRQDGEGEWEDWLGADDNYYEEEPDEEPSFSFPSGGLMDALNQMGGIQPPIPSSAIKKNNTSSAATSTTTSSSTDTASSPWDRFSNFDSNKKEYPSGKGDSKSSIDDDSYNTSNDDGFDFII